MKNGLAGYIRSSITASFFYRIAILCLLVTFLFQTEIKATHIIGGEMTYRYVAEAGTNKKTYEFLLTVYRDCGGNGAQLDDPASVTVYKLFQGVYTLVTNKNVTPTIVTVPQIVPKCINPNNVPNSCVQRGTYLFTQNLDVQAGVSYLIVYQRCCRTGQIQNIQNPSAFGATYMVELSPETIAANDSSPTFVNYPPTFICNSFDLDFDHSATDANGDSLVYEFYTPLTGGGQNGGGGNCNSPMPSPACPPPFATINFAAGYNVAAPMGGNPTININPNTGIMGGKPNLIGKFVVGICVKSYRNGVFISRICREFQFTTVDCDALVVADIAEDSILGASQFLIKKCGQKTVTVLNQSAMSPALINQKWVFDFGNGSVFETTTWNATVTFPDYGEYTGTLYLNPGGQCTDTGFIKLKLFPDINADFGYSFDTCVIGPVSFKDKSVSGAVSGVNSWQWTFGNTGITDSITDPVITFAIPGSYAVKLHVVDTNQCADDFIKNVTWSPRPLPPIPLAGPWRTCLPYPVNFQVFDSLTLVALVGTTVTWNFGDNNTQASIFNPEYSYTAPGNFTPSVFVESQYGCIATDTFANAVDVYPPPIANFDYLPDSPSNLKNEVHFSDLSQGVAVWDWELPNGKRFSSIPDPVYVFAEDTGLTAIKLKVFNQYGCVDSITKVIDIEPKIRIYIPNVFTPENPDQSVNGKFNILGILPGYQAFKMQIWSRWGDLVFESNDPAEGWDGSSARGGKTLSPGVYVYNITMLGPRGEPYHWEGTVTLLN